jgi:hypothetical protein
MSMNEKIARELVAVAQILAGCEKLPEGPMRDNCEKKKEEGKKNGKKDDKKPDFLKKKAGMLKQDGTGPHGKGEGPGGGKADGSGKKDAAWEPVRKDVDVRMRNKEVNQSLTSYAPRISTAMRKKAAVGLEREGFDVNPRALSREWSVYLAYIAPEENANKYHYYVVYSFETPEGTPMYVGWNCSGRIGIIERAYDLTDKYIGGPTMRLNQAIAACEKHLNTKLRKGYERMKMIRG